MSSLRLKVFPLLVLSLLAGACKSTPPANPEPTPTDGGIRFQNNTQYTIQFVYYSICASGTWGADRMPNGVVISPSLSRTFIVDPGCWDARVVTTTGLSAQWSSLNVTAGNTVTVTVTNFLRAE